MDLKIEDQRDRIVAEGIVRVLESELIAVEAAVSPHFLGPDDLGRYRRIAGAICAEIRVQLNAAPQPTALDR